MTTGFLTCILLTRRLCNQLLEPVCGYYGITRMELDILLFLHNRPGHGTAADIIKVKHLTKSHVSSSVKTLEEQGYLEKFCQGSSGRTIHLKVTDKAAEILAGGLKAQRAFSNLAFQNFGDEQIADVEKNSKQLTDDVQTALAGGKKHGL